MKKISFNRGLSFILSFVMIFSAIRVEVLAYVIYNLQEEEVYNPYEDYSLYEEEYELEDETLEEYEVLDGYEEEIESISYVSPEFWIYPSLPGVIEARSGESLDFSITVNYSFDYDYYELEIIEFLIRHLDETFILELEEGLEVDLSRLGYITSFGYYYVYVVYSIFYEDGIYQDRNEFNLGFFEIVEKEEEPGSEAPFRMNDTGWEALRDSVGELKNKIDRSSLSSPIAIRDGVTYNYAVIDLEGDIELDLGLITPLVVDESVEKLFLRGNTGDIFENFSLIVEGNTQIILHNFRFSSIEGYSAIYFKGDEGILISLGTAEAVEEEDEEEEDESPAGQNLIVGRGKTTLTARGDLSIFGVARLKIESKAVGHNNAPDAININGHLHIGFKDMGRPALEVIAGDGVDGVRLNNGNAGSATSGGDAVHANSLYISRTSTVSLVGGRGGNSIARGGTSGSNYTGAVRHGQPGGFLVVATRGQDGGPGGHGRNGFNSNDAGYGGSPLVVNLPRNSPLVDNLSAYSNGWSENTLVQITAGRGGNSRAGDGGRGGNGGQGGDGGRPTLDRIVPGGDGGRGGNAGKGGNSGNAGNHGSLEFVALDNVLVTDPIAFTGSSIAGVAGSPGQGGNGGRGRNSRGGLVGFSLGLLGLDGNGNNGENGNTAISGTRGNMRLYPGPGGIPELTYGFLFPSVSIIEIGTSYVDETDGSFHFNTENQFAPGELITARVTFNVGVDRNWFYSIRDSFYDNRRSDNFSISKSPGDINIVRVKRLPEGSPQTKFYIIFENTVNTTGEPLETTIIGRSTSFDDDISTVTSNPYTNLPIIFTEKIEIVEHTLYESEGGNLILYALYAPDRSAKIQARTLGYIRENEYYVNDDGETVLIQSRNSATFSEIRWRIEANGTNILRDGSYQIEEIDGYSTLNITDFSIFYGIDGTVNLILQPYDYDRFGRLDNQHMSEYVIPIHISHEPPHRIEFFPWHQLQIEIQGRDARFTFDSPAHALLIPEGSSYQYTIEVFRLLDHNTNYVIYNFLDYYRENGNPVSRLTTPHTSFTIPTSNLSITLSEEGTPTFGYIVFVSINAGEVYGEIYDLAGLTIIPEPLNLRFPRPSIADFRDDIGTVELPFVITGLGDGTVRAEILRNNLLVAANSNIAINGYEGTISFSPSPVNSGSLTNAYQVTLIAEIYSDGIQTTRRATQTIRVFNTDSITITGSTNLNNRTHSFLNNTPIRSYNLQRSNSILLNRSVFNLSTYTGVNRDIGWQPHHSMQWSSSDTEILTLNRQQGSSFVSLESLQNANFSPDQRLRSIGHNDGSAVVRATHAATGIYGEAYIQVQTLRNRLFLLSVQPAVRTEVLFTNGDGETITLFTNDEGYLAIYEPSGLIGEMRFRSVVGNSLYLGTLLTYSLLSGENGAGLYPMNHFELLKVSDQTFFAHLPNGAPYRGNVDFRGSIFVNGTYIPNSIITELNREVESGGRFTIRMDTTRFGEISINDEIEFVYEIIFRNGNFAPMLVRNNGFANPTRNLTTADAILNLIPWDGTGFIPVLYTYEDFQVSDVTRNTSYVGPDIHYPEGTLTTTVVFNGQTEISGFRYTDDTNHTPRNQDLRRLSYTFLSGVYNFYEIVLEINDQLGLTAGVPRYHAIYAISELGSLLRVPLPFGIISTYGLSIPSDMTNFNFDISSFLTDSSIFSSVLGGEAATEVAKDILSGLITMDFSSSDSMPFRIHFYTEANNPLLVNVKGHFQHPRPSRSSSQIEDAERVYFSTYGYGIKFHRSPNSRGLVSTRRAGERYHGNPYFYISSGTVEYAMLLGLSPSLICWPNGIDRNFIQEFTEIQRQANSNRSSGTSVNQRFQAYFTAEIGWDIQNEEWVFEFTRLHVSYRINVRYTMPTKRIPIKAPVPLFLTLEFSAGGAVEIGATLFPDRRIEDLELWERLILYSTIEAFIQLRAALAVDIVLAAADIGASLRLTAGLETVVQPVLLARSGFDWGEHGALRTPLSASINVSSNFRVGPIWPNRLNHRWSVDWWSWDSGNFYPERTLLGNQNLFNIRDGNFGASTNRAIAPTNFMPASMAVAPTSFLPALLTISNFSSTISDLPEIYIPNETPLVEGNRDFAVAVWSFTGILEEELYEIDDIRARQGLYSLEETMDIGDFVALANQSDIVAAVFNGERWSQTDITFDLFSNSNPVLAVNGQNAVVVWQQMLFGETEEVEIYEMQNGVAVPTVGTGINILSTELMYSRLGEFREQHYLHYSLDYLIEGWEWSYPRSLGISVDGILNDYSVSMNNNGDFTVIISQPYYEVVDGEYIFFDTVTTVHVPSSGGMNSGNITQSGVSAIGNINMDTNIRSLGTRFDGGFIFSYYTDGGSGRDVVIGRITQNGMIDHDFVQSLSYISSVFDVHLGLGHKLISDGEDVVVVWSAYSRDYDGFGIYAMKLVRHSNGELGFSAPIEVISPETGMDLSIVDGALVNGQIRIEYTVQLLGEFDLGNEVPRLTRFGYGNFENNIKYDISFENHEIVANSELPIYLQVTNAGLDKVSEVRFTVGNTSNNSSFNSSSGYYQFTFSPGQSYNKYVMVPLGSNISNLEYRLEVTMGSDTIIRNGILEIAMPSISLSYGRITRAEYGIREFDFTLWNDSDVYLYNSGNNIQLSFWHDAGHTIPANVRLITEGALSSSNITVISSREMIYLADMGGLNLTFKYEIEQEDLNSYGEVFSSGVRIFVRANVVDAQGNYVRELDYSRNSGNVIFYSLLRDQTPSILPEVTYFSTQNRTADITISNLSMNESNLTGYRLVAVLYRNSTTPIEVQSIYLSGPIDGESVLNYEITFENSGGSFVNVNITPVNLNSTLAHLSLSEIPLTFDLETVTSGSEVEIDVQNIHNVRSTSILAISYNPEAIVTILDTSGTGQASRVINLNASNDYVRIMVTAGNVTTTYIVNIFTESFIQYDLVIEVRNNNELRRALGASGNTAFNSLPSSLQNGTTLIRVMNDITLDQIAQVVDPGGSNHRNVVLIADGPRNITVNGNREHFRVNNRTTLNIFDSNLNIVGRNPYSSSQTAFGGGIDVRSGGTLILTEGNIRNVSGLWPNNAVHVRNSGRFIMDGGIIENNRSNFGGGVAITGANARFEMNEGVIRYNFATIYGGGVDVDLGATFDMNGGTITSNFANGNSGGVRVDSRGTFNMNDGVISYNTANGGNDNGGGGVGVFGTGSIFNMFNGIINNNIVTNDAGGGVRVNTGGLFNMHGGIIENNVVTNNGRFPYGGGVAVFHANSTFNMNGGTIRNNTAHRGGGVAAWEAIFNMGTGRTTVGRVNNVNVSNEVPEILGNIATGGGDGPINTTGLAGGGGVFVYGMNANRNNVNFTMNSGIISENTSNLRGGGVFLNAANFRLNGGSINNNSAYVGGGIFLHNYLAASFPATFSMSGGYVVDNVAYEDSSVARLDNRNTITINGGTID